MSSSSRAGLWVAVFICLDRSVVLGWFGRGRVGPRQVRKGLGGRPARPIDAVADDWPIAGIDQLREERVHHVVVEGAAAAGLVLATLPGCELDLEERTLLDVRLRDVDNQEVREYQFGQRMAAVRTAGPVRLPVEPVPKGEVGIQPRPVST